MDGLRLMQKQKIDLDNTECPQCKKKIGPFKNLLMCKDGGSRVCPHCAITFHKCAAGRYGFDAPLTCRRCLNKPSKEQRARSKRRRQAKRHLQAVMRSTVTDPAAGRALDDFLWKITGGRPKRGNNSAYSEEEIEQMKEVMIKNLG